MPLLVREMAEQVAIRLRRRDAKATTVHLFIGYSRDEASKGFSRQTKILATNDTKELTDNLMVLFNKFYDGRSFIRNIGVTYSNLVYEGGSQLDLFEDPSDQEKRIKIDKAMDLVREKYGFVSIVKASSTLENGRSIKRAGLVGGHAGGAGGLDGL